MANLYAPTVESTDKSTDDWNNNWDHYEACPYYGAEVKCLHAKHNELEAFLKSIEVSPGTNVTLDGGRMRVAIERDIRYYHEDIKYTAGLSVYLYTGEGYMCHRKNWSYKFYDCDNTSPMEVLMAYTKALTEASAINTLLPSGKPIVKSRQKRSRDAKVQHDAIKEMLDICGKTVTLVDGTTLTLKGMNRSEHVRGDGKFLWDWRTYAEDLTNYPLVGVQVMVTGKHHVNTIYMGADIIKTAQAYVNHAESIGIQPTTKANLRCGALPYSARL